MNLQQWLAQQNPRFSEKNIAAVIGSEFAFTEPLDLNRLFHDSCFLASWQEHLQIIISLEVWTSDYLIQLHEWLRNQPARINNFCLLVIGQPGISSWWETYKKFWNIKSFSIHEVLDLPFSNITLQGLAKQDIKDQWGRHLWYSDFTTDLPQLERKIQYHALYMAGRVPHSVESGYYKQYLICRLAELIPNIKFDIWWDIVSAAELSSWVDKEIYWQDQKQIDLIPALREAVQKYPRGSCSYKTGYFSDSIPLYSNTFATVSRETLLRQPYGCVSEKTIRAFYFGQYVIPVTYGSWDYLKDLGFWFDPEVIDLSFTRELDHMRRLDLMMAALQRFIADWSLEDLQRHLAQHRRSYQHNSQLAAELVQLQSL